MMKRTTLTAVMLLASATYALPVPARRFPKAPRRMPRQAVRARS